MERFLTFWPVDARLVHIRDLHAPDPYRALCSRRWQIEDGSSYTIAPGDEDLVCATCTKIRARREGAR